MDTDGRSAKDCQKLIGAAALRPGRDARVGVGFLLDEEVLEDLEHTMPQYPHFYSVHT